MRVLLMLVLLLALISCYGQNNLETHNQELYNEAYKIVEDKSLNLEAMTDSVLAIYGINSLDLYRYNPSDVSITQNGIDSILAIVALKRADENPSQLCYYKNKLGYLFVFRSNAAMAHTYAIPMVECGEKVGVGEFYFALSAMTTSYWGAGMKDEAMVFAKKRYEVSLDMGDLYLAWVALNNYGYYLGQIGKTDSSVIILQAAGELALENFGEGVNQLSVGAFAESKLVLSYALAGQDKFAQAAQAVKEALDSLLKDAQRLKEPNAGRINYISRCCFELIGYYTRLNMPDSVSKYAKEGRKWTKWDPNTNLSLASSYSKFGMHKKAIGYLEKAFKKPINTQSWRVRAYSVASKVYDKSGMTKKALEYYRYHALLKDSIDSELNKIRGEIERENARMKFNLQLENINATNLAAKLSLEVDNERNKASITKQRYIIISSIIGLILIIFLALSMYKGKKRSDELLLNILPAETAKELKTLGHSDAKLINQATVLFTDFQNFTGLSEKLSPKALVADLHACFSEFDHISEKFGIEKIKTIGDSYMAAGGLPIPNSTHAQDIVKAALEIAEAVERGKAEKIAKNQPFFEVRIGIHTGTLVAGIVGVKKFQYDIWGDTVNTASRMESSGEIGKVNISESTYALLKDNPEFTFESRGKIQAKGKGEVEMYFVSHSSKSKG